MEQCTLKSCHKHFQAWQTKKCTLCVYKTRERFLIRYFFLHIFVQTDKDNFGTTILQWLEGKEMVCKARKVLQFARIIDLEGGQ